MKSQHTGFPLVIGLMMPGAAPVSEGVLASVGDVLRALRGRTRFGILVVHSARGELAKQIAEIAKDGEAVCRTIEVGTLPAETRFRTGGVSIAEMELVGTSDVLVLVSDQSSDESDLFNYARGIDRPVIRIDAENGALNDDIPQQIETQQGWLSELFETAGLSPEADLETIKVRMSAIANRTGPLTRRHWKWILLVEGLAVLIPAAWLVRRPANVPVGWVAVVILSAVALLVAVSWWVRWRGMEKTWARARLVAELSRSLIATADCPRMPALESLAIVPALRPLRWIADTAGSGRSSFEWRDYYLANRIDHQERYFATKQAQAEKQRQRLSRWITLLLDIALALAFAGIVIAIVPEEHKWIRIFGDTGLEMFLGIAGVLMPLGLLLIQLLRGMLELNGRAGRFAQQRHILTQARARLAVPNSEIAMQVVDETERALLAEVLDWYFRAETAEHFFQLGTEHYAKHQLKLGKTSPHAPARALAGRILGASGIAGLFLLRVVLGRVPWIVGSGVVAMAWIAFHLPGDASEKAKLVSLATLHGTDGGAWIPDSVKAEHGCVIIVHGLHGHSLWTADKNDWMQQCADAIEKRVGKDNSPNICLVDWQGVATPSKVYNFNLFESETAGMIQDVVAIREQAYQVGEQLGMRLALLIADGMIKSDQPLHLIGHSAGGFVVTRAARTLKKLNLASPLLYVTILDTPAPNDEVLFDLPGQCPTDFYITSGWGGATPLGSLANFSARNMHEKQISPPAKQRTEIDKHRWAYTWFIETIANPDGWPGEGFNRSPLLNRAASR